MENIYYEGQVLWSMIDANGHLRHSAYADLAAQARVNILAQSGLAAALYQAKIGPILFREELIYLREIRLNQSVKVSVELVACRPDASRYSLLSNIYRADGVHAAEIHIDGAWMDLEKRKLCILPEDMRAVFLGMPKTAAFREVHPVI